MCSSSWYGMHAWPGKVIRLWLEWNFWRFWLDQEFLILVHFARMRPCTPFTHLLGLKSEMLKLKITQLSSYFKINLCILNGCGDVLSNALSLFLISDCKLLPTALVCCTLSANGLILPLQLFQQFPNKCFSFFPTEISIPPSMTGKLWKFLWNHGRILIFPKVFIFVSKQMYLFLFFVFVSKVFCICF